MSGVVVLRFFAVLNAKHRAGEPCDSYLSLLQQDDARNALQIRPDFEQFPDVRVDKAAHSFTLTEADFHAQMAVLLKKFWGFLNQTVNNAESVEARRKCNQRLMIAHLAL